MISFRCPDCGEEMEISRKGVGKRVRCLISGATIEVPPPGRRQYTAEEKETLRSITEKADREHREQLEKEKRRRD